MTKLLKKLFSRQAHTQAEPNKLMLQHTAIAGFQYYRGEQLWDFLRQDLPLQLRREPHNRFDHNAVAIYWNDNKLGFVPKSDNQAIAKLLDNGQPLQARIAKLKESMIPRNRVDVLVELVV